MNVTGPLSPWQQGPAGPRQLGTKDQRADLLTLGGSHSFVPFTSAGKQNNRQLLNCWTLLNVKHFWSLCARKWKAKGLCGFTWRETHADVRPTGGNVKLLLLFESHRSMRGTLLMEGREGPSLIIQAKGGGVYDAVINTLLTSLVLGWSVQSKFSLQEIWNLVCGFCRLHNCLHWWSPSDASLFPRISSSSSRDLEERDYVFTRLNILDFIYLRTFVGGNDGYDLLDCKINPHLTTGRSFWAFRLT